jgi:predicted RNA-binding Zn ribbon-like protein
MISRFVRWIGHPELADQISDADLPRFRALRTALRSAFEASSELRAVAALNGVLAANPSISELRAEGNAWTFRHRAADASDPVATLAVEAAIALLIAIRDRGWDRFGICAGSPCTCVYVDGSKNRSRRYCSDLCNDRISQVAQRRRRRAAAGPSSGRSART